MPSIRLLDCALATYSYATIGFSPVASATDIWQLQVPAGCTCKVRWIEIGGTAASAKTYQVALIRRSTKNTGGTSTTPAIAKADAADGNPQSVVVQWTANPASLGTAVATIDGGSVALVAQAGPAAIQDRALFMYDNPIYKSITLGSQNPSVPENLSINFAGVATAGTEKIDLSMWWTEQ